ncbi:MAG: hypothetical protein LBD82_07385 [Deltaproteobacteria bacterium]|nr:hypothetical protein [Deltaproteobacteria bacterium]
MEEKKDSMISFRVSETERYKMKELAAHERKTLKQLVFDALEKAFPGWQDKK